MTETARMADIVLPATMFLEHDDIYQASGHTRIQIARKIFEPFAECRTNHFVVCALAGRLGADHPGFGMTEWQLIDDLLRRSGWPDAETIDEAGGWDALPDYETAHHLNGFPTPDGRFQFKPDWRKLGPRPCAHAEAARPLGDHRRGGRGASLPPRGGAGAPVPEHQLHRDADLAAQGGPPDRPDPSR